MHHARRYYADAYTTSFEARIVERLDLDGRPAVVLDQTYFYPTSGGQPHDRGHLDTTRVVDVTIRDADGAVLHILDAPLANDRVEGRIDWARRFDHMQQHTGQHVLSQAFVRIAGAATIGFHLGDEYVSIDLDAPALDDAAARDGFDLANEIVRDNAAVRAWFPSEAELSTLALRKTPEVDGALRVVAIGDFDRSACGGTHVARTGEIGLIQHLRTERLKRGTRVAFLAGGRAQRDYALKHGITSRLSSQLTCAIAELPGVVARLQDELQTTRRELGRLVEEGLGREADRLRADAPSSQGARMVVRAWDARPVEELRTLVLKGTAADDTIMLLGTAGARAQFVFGRSEALPIDLRPALEAAFSVIGNGRGGGSRIVQGGCGEASLAAVERALESARNALAR